MVRHKREDHWGTIGKTIIHLIKYPTYITPTKSYGIHITRTKPQRTTIDLHQRNTLTVLEIIRNP